MSDHAHKCANTSCGHIWRHANTMAGNKAAHTCEKCGTEQWWKHFPDEDNRQRSDIDEIRAALRALLSY